MGHTKKKYLKKKKLKLAPAFRFYFLLLLSVSKKTSKFDVQENGRIEIQIRTCF